jgi:putative protein-disulfide isomerase
MATLEALDKAYKPNWRLLPLALYCRHEPMTAERAAFFWQHDQRIHALTGQPFSEAYQQQVLQSLKVPFDSTNATLAFDIISRQIAPDQGIYLLHDISKIRFVDGMAQTLESLSEVAEKYGINARDFAEQFNLGWSDNLEQNVAEARNLMQKHNTNGVPTLIINDNLMDNNLTYNIDALMAVL